MLGACAQPSSSLSNIVHVATANKAMYALSEGCTCILEFRSLSPYSGRKQSLTCVVCIHEPLLPLILLQCTVEPLYIYQIKDIFL